jgi:hypothetical protein
MSPFYLLAIAIFKPKIYCINTPTILYTGHNSHHLPVKTKQTKSSEKSAYIFQTPGNNPEENT